MPQINLASLPDSAYLRATQLVQKSRLEPAVLPFSAPTLWRRVAHGTFPAPIKLSAGITCWRVADIKAWLAAQSANPTHS
jgi:prophage regulatory protein